MIGQSRTAVLISLSRTAVLISMSRTAALISQSKTTVLISLSRTAVLISLIGLGRRRTESALAYSFYAYTQTVTASVSPTEKNSMFSRLDYDRHRDVPIAFWITLHQQVSQKSTKKLFKSTENTVACASFLGSGNENTVTCASFLGHPPPASFTTSPQRKFLRAPRTP